MSLNKKGGQTHHCAVSMQECNDMGVVVLNGSSVNRMDINFDF